jgi:glycosyltransferase involved in cell wall biosynthesis
MKIGILCAYPLPQGLAATSRIWAYSKGMVSLGHQVQAFSFIPSGRRQYSTIQDNSGYFEGVYYCYPFRRKRVKNKLLHGTEIIISLFLTLISIYRENKKEKYDSIIVSTDHIFYLCCFSALKVLLGMKLIFIFDEYPIPIRKYLKNKIPKAKIYCYKIILKFYAGYISMTDVLIEFYDAILFKSGIVISSITDISRFTPLNYKKNHKRKNLTYLGNMELSKDNVDNIINAFATLVTDFNDIDLYLYGTPSIQDKEFLDSLIEKHHISDRVFFRFALYNEVPDVLYQSYILLSSQPQTKRASGGFPTKLGEYLATGVPVLLTNVGEISNYVTDRQEVYLSVPDSPLDYANKLRDILTNYDEAIEVGKRGKKLIIESYSHVHAGKLIIEFIKKI